MGSELGRVLDAGALSAAEGPRARLRVDIPSTWVGVPVDLVVTAPARLVCARCDGGGCDGCERSGALRAPADATSRVIRTSVGASALAPRLHSSVVLRISEPFGPEGIAQLLLEVRVAEAPSTCVVRVAPAAARSPILVWQRVALVAVGVSAAVAALIELLHR